MKALVYCCEASKKGKTPWVPYDYAATLEGFHQRYRKLNINGILTYMDGHFFHCLEGKEQDINRAVFSDLMSKRLNHFKVLMNENVKSKIFDRWHMCVASVSYTHLTLPTKRIV